MPFTEKMYFMKRIGTISKLVPGTADEYIELHKNVWPGVIQAGHDAHMQNFSIFRWGDYLFSYYEYTGDDFEGDMEKKAALPVSQDWQAATGKCRQLINGEARFIELEEIWHEDFSPLSETDTP